jgi:hypothetical protein
LKGSLDPVNHKEGEEVQAAKSETEALANAPPGYVPPPIAIAQTTQMSFTVPMPVMQAPCFIAAPIYNMPMGFAMPMGYSQP